MRRQVLSCKGPGHTVLAGWQLLPPCPRALGTAWPCLTCVPRAVCLASQRPVSTFTWSWSEEGCRLVRSPGHCPYRELPGAGSISPDDRVVGTCPRHWVLRDPRWPFLLPQPWEVGPGSPSPFHRRVHGSSELLSSAVKVPRWPAAKADTHSGAGHQTRLLPHVPSGARVCPVGCQGSKLCGWKTLPQPGWKSSSTGLCRDPERSIR